MRLSDITLYYSNPDLNIQRKFTGYQNVINDLYVHFLGNYKPKNVSRISISIGKEDDPGSLFGSICGPIMAFDTTHFWEIDDLEKYKIILENTHRIITKCAIHYGWDLDAFENAYSLVVQNNYKYEIESEKKTSPDKKKYASIKHVKNHEFGEIRSVIYDLKGGIISEDVLLKIFHKSRGSYLLHNYRWFNKNEFGITIVPKEMLIVSKIDSNTVERVFKPIRYSLKELEIRLSWSEYRTFENEEERRKWVQQ